MADVQVVPSLDAEACPGDKVSVQVTVSREMSCWLGNYGYTKLAADGDKCTLDVAGLRAYGTLLSCLSDGYEVFECGNMDTRTGIDLSGCPRKGLKKLIVTDATYVRLESATPGVSVPVEIAQGPRPRVGWAAHVFVAGAIFDVVSYSNSVLQPQLRIVWVGSHPEVDSSVRYARVL